MESNQIITFLACIVFLFLFGRIFILPLKKILKLILNSILGGVLIYVINLIGSIWGFYIGLNIYTCILVRNFRNSRSYFISNFEMYNRVKNMGPASWNPFGRVLIRMFS